MDTNVNSYMCTNVNSPKRVVARVSEEAAESVCGKGLHGRGTGFSESEKAKHDLTPR